MTETFGAAQYLSLAQTPLFGSAANSVVAFQARMPEKPDWYVFVVRSRGTEKAVSSDQEAQKPTDQQLTSIGTRFCSRTWPKPGCASTPGTACGMLWAWTSRRTRTPRRAPCCP